MFVFNGSQISSPPPPSESAREDITLPPIPSKHSPSQYSEDTTSEHEGVEGTMPSEFYANVDQFLSLNPPSLKTMLGKKKGAGGDRASVQQLKSERSKLRKNKSTTSDVPNIQPQRKSGIGRGVQKQVSGESFDYGLLAEAMKFTKGLTMSDREEFQLDERSDRLAGGSPPRQGNPVNALRRKQNETKKNKVAVKGVENVKSSKSKSSKGSSVYESQRSKHTLKPKARRNSGGAFDGGIKTADADDRADINSMVQNFEQGLELSRLRAELAASQQRMHNSTSVIKSAASEFYGSPQK